MISPRRWVPASAANGDDCPPPGRKKQDAAVRIPCRPLAEAAKPKLARGLFP
jgi:hypothetical protein